MERLEAIYREVAKEVNLPVEVIREINNSYYRFIKSKIEEISLKDIDEDTFSTLRLSFNLPSLGKIGVTKDKFTKVKNVHNYLKKVFYEDKEN